MARVGVLALQGAFAAHGRALRRLGAAVCEVRVASDLEGLDALVLPGGESTTMRQLGGERGLFPAIRARVAAGLPVLGTCAGAILLAREVDGDPDFGMGLLDLGVTRNAYGSQLDSFVQASPPAPHPRVFIRAPRFTAVGPELEVLDRLEPGGEPVVVRQGRITACAYHPELTADPWLHARLLADVR